MQGNAECSSTALARRLWTPHPQSFGGGGQPPPGEHGDKVVVVAGHDLAEVVGGRKVLELQHRQRLCRGRQGGTLLAGVVWLPHWHSCPSPCPCLDKQTARNAMPTPPPTHPPTHPTLPTHAHLHARPPRPRRSACSDQKTPCPARHREKESTKDSMKACMAAEPQGRNGGEGTTERARADAAAMAGSSSSRVTAGRGSRATAGRRQLQLLPGRLPRAPWRLARKWSSQ